MRHVVMLQRVTLILNDGAAEGEERRVQLRRAVAGGGHAEEAAGARPVHCPGDEGRKYSARIRQHRPIAPPLLTCSTRHHHLEQD